MDHVEKDCLSVFLARIRWCQDKKDISVKKKYEQSKQQDFPKLGSFNLKKKKRILRYKKNKMLTTFLSEKLPSIQVFIQCHKKKYLINNSWDDNNNS